MPSESLPLFSEFAYDWTRRTEFTALVSKVLRIRRKYHALVTNPDHETFRMLNTGSDAVLAYARQGGGQGKRLAVVANLNCTNSVETAVPLDSPRKTVTDLVTGKRIRLTAGTLQTELGPGESLVFEY